MTNAKDLLKYLLELEKQGFALDKVDLIAWDGDDNHTIENFELDCINQEELIFNI